MTEVAEVFSIVRKVEISHRTIKSVLVGWWEGSCSWRFRIEKRNFANGLNSKDFKEGGRFADPEQSAFGDYFPSHLPFVEGCSLTLKVENPNNDMPLTFILNLEAIQKGLNIMSEKYPKLFQEIIDGNDDINTSDVLAQCIVYGEEVFS